MDHYLIKNNNRFCYIDDNNALKCDNKYQYHDDLATKFAFQSSGKNNARYCIQSKKNNKFATLQGPSKTLVFTKDDCDVVDDTNQFVISFLDVFDTTTFRLEKESSLCRTVNDDDGDGGNIDYHHGTVRCDGIDEESSKHTMFTLLQESKQQCQESSAGMWHSLGSYLPGYSDVVDGDGGDGDGDGDGDDGDGNGGNAPSDSLYNSVVSILTYNEDDGDGDDQESSWYSSIPGFSTTSTTSTTEPSMSNMWNETQSW